MKYKFLEHTADVKFVVYGKTLSKVFENAALAFCEVIGRGEKIKNKKKRKIKLKGKDLESLMYNFLDELIYLLDAKNFLVSEVKVKINEKKFVLGGEVYGDSSKKYDDLDHIKAATYSEMHIKQKRSGEWEAQVVVDV